MKLVFLFGLLLSAASFYPYSFGDKVSVADKAAQNAPQEKDLARHEAKIEAGGRALLRTRKNALAFPQKREQSTPGKNKEEEKRQSSYEYRTEQNRTEQQWEKISYELEEKYGNKGRKIWNEIKETWNETWSQKHVQASSHLLRLLAKMH